eukprot:gene8006-16389_t
MGLKDLFSIKYGALAMLVLQNTFLVVFMRYSRTQSGPLYASSTAVASMEFLKFITCLAVIAYEQGGIFGLATALREEIYKKPYEILKLAIPSLLYTIQNNLLYFALSHLDAATYQVCYQPLAISGCLSQQESMENNSSTHPNSHGNSSGNRDMGLGMGMGIDVSMSSSTSSSFPLTIHTRNIGGGSGSSSASGGGGGGGGSRGSIMTSSSAMASTASSFWTRFDNTVMKPYFGGGSVSGKNNTLLVAESATNSIMIDDDNDDDIDPYPMPMSMSSSRRPRNAMNTGQESGDEHRTSPPVVYTGGGGSSSSHNDNGDNKWEQTTGLATKRRNQTPSSSPLHNLLRELSQLLPYLLQWIFVVEHSSATEKSVSNNIAIDLRTWTLPTFTQTKEEKSKIKNISRILKTDAFNRLSYRDPTAQRPLTYLTQLCIRHRIHPPPNDNPPPLRHKYPISHTLTANQ